MPTHSDPDDDGGLPEWVVADLFGASARRVVLCQLHRADGPVPVCDLVTALAEQSTTADTHRDARMELFQTHLPKLTATEVVEFDSVQGTLRLADAADALAPRLADCPDP